MNCVIEIQEMTFQRKDVACIRGCGGMLCIELKDQELRFISEDEWGQIECFFSPCVAIRIKRYFANYHPRCLINHITVVINFA